MEQEYSKICRLSFKEEAVTLELYIPAVMYSAYSFSVLINYRLAVTHSNLLSNSPLDFAESLTVEWWHGYTNAEYQNKHEKMDSPGKCPVILFVLITQSCRFN